MISLEIDCLIDRLVDDELEPAERRALLARLDAEPEGWRRCALAFLEAQCWRATLTPQTRETSRPPVRRSRSVHALVGLAAGVFVAFVLGWAAGGTSNARRPSLAERPRPEPVAPVPEISPASQVVHTVAQTSSPPTPTLDERWLRQAPTPLPDSVRREWERHGFQIEPQHKLLAMEGKNGQRLAVPVEALKLRYVGNRTY